MKPSAYTTPRQLADATFVTGHAGIQRSSTHPAERLMLVLAAFVVGLIVGGVL